MLKYFDMEFTIGEASLGTVKPLYNVPPYNVFLPIAFKMFGPGKVP